jgi:hypothetical protein
MINGLGYKLANVPTVTGLSSIVADSIISDTTNTSTLIVNGVDVSFTLAQVPINTNNITLLQQATTGITYDAVGDLTTIDNNVTVGSNYIRTSYAALGNTDVTNKLYVDNKVASLVDSAPVTLDTLNELAAALGDDPNFATTVATSLGDKASLTASQTFLGTNTFSILPVCSAVVSSGSQLVNKTYVDSVIPVFPTNYVTTNTSQTITSNKTFTSNIIMDDGTSKNTTIKQNAISNLFEMTQNYNSGGYLFTSKVGSTNKTVSINGNSVSAEEINILDSVSGLNYTRHTYISPNYTIDNLASNGSIILKTSNASISTTPLIINSTNCTFENLPVCSALVTSGTQLVNKNYVDSVIPVIPTNYVTTNTIQTITSDKTFTGNIIMSNGSTYSTTIDQYDTQLNIINNSLNNVSTSFVGLVPSVNLSCIVRTDAVGVVAGYGKLSGPIITGMSASGQIPFNNPYNSNYYLYGTTTSTPAIQVQSLSTIQCNDTLTIGSFMTTFIGTRFVLGTYITADLGLGVYSITPNALVSTSAKSTTGVSYMNTNRPYASGGAVAGTIYVDYNTRTNIQCKNTSSVLLDAITYTPKLTTSQVDVYGDCKFQGGLQYNLGGTITTTRTLTTPLAQLYLITQSAAIAVTLPTASTSLNGTMVQFRRITTSVGGTTFNQTGGATVMYAVASLTATANVSFLATAFYTVFLCTGSAWIQTTL